MSAACGIDYTTLTAVRTIEGGTARKECLAVGNGSGPTTTKAVNVKVFLYPAPEKFNTFNTFNTFDPIAQLSSRPAHRAGYPRSGWR